MTASRAYEENHAFALLFTVIAAASQGLGGLIAVMGMQDAYGNSVAHLMSFSTGVMLYLSFMDIMFDTTQSEAVGEMFASAAFFVGMGLFLCLEVCLPEVEGTQLGEIFGMAWVDSDSPQKEPKKARPTAKASLDLALADEPMPPSTPTKGSLRQRSAAVGDNKDHDDINHADPSDRRMPRSPTRRASKDGDVASGKPKRSPARQQSPPPSKKRESFEKEGGEATLSASRKKSIAFSGIMCMVSISLHNIPEGIAVYLTCLKGVKSGLPLAIAMSLHNIPEGMAVAGPLYAATKSKRRAVLAATISGAFEILGSLLVQLFFDSITPFIMEMSLSLVAGIMVGLALIELLPSCLEVLSPRAMGCSCVGGMVFMCVSKFASHEMVSYFG